jgi:hypothetical protein
VIVRLSLESMVLFGVVIGVAVGVSSACSEVGDPCAATSDCDTDEECVFVERESASVCLPRPTERDERTCVLDDDCRRSDGQLWPLEAVCVAGSCRCDGDTYICSPDLFGGDDDTVTLEQETVLQDETCRCLARSTTDGSCITSHTCDVGLACVLGVCRVSSDAGQACRNNRDCVAEGTECGDFRGGNDTGVCVPRP